MSRPAPSELAIRARGLTKSFGATVVLEGVDLDVAEGTVHALLGPNGAGKTTIVRMLTTLLRPDGGEATVGGHDVITEAGAVRRTIGLSGQYAAVDEHLTGFENLQMLGRLYGMSRPASKQRARELLERFRLTDAADRRSGTYSGGMRRRLDLAGALVARPRVLVLDEPTTGLDPRSRLDMWDVIADLVGDGVAVLLTTQYLEEADRLADKITVIDGGRVIALGTAEELKGRVHGSQLKVQVADAAGLAEAVRVLSAVGVEPPAIDERGRRVQVKVNGGPAVMMDALRRLDAAAIPLSDLELQTSSLDDVFLALTGHEAEADAAGTGQRSAA